MLDGLGLGRYWLGAPLTRAGRESYKRQLVERFVEEYAHLNGLPPEIVDNPKVGGNLAGQRQAAEAFAYDRACALVDRTLERVTDKSVGLLQVMGLSAAAQGAVSEPAVSTISAPLLMTLPNALAIVLLGVTSLLLLTNMFIAWYSDKTTYRDREKNIDRLLYLAATRSVRLAIALHLSVVVILATGVSLFLAFPTDWGAVFDPIVKVIQNIAAHVQQQ